MAEFIRLAAMPKGKRYKTLSIAEKDYIDRNYQWEMKQTMATTLGLQYMDVDVYCRNKGYSTPDKNRVKPKTVAKNKTFDVDSLNTWI